MKVTEDIDALVQQQREQRAHRRKLAQDLKNAKKKKERLQKRARLLSTEDLLTVVAVGDKESYSAATLFSSSQSTADPEDEGSAEDAEQEQLEDSQRPQEPGGPESSTGGEPK